MPQIRHRRTGKVLYETPGPSLACKTIGDTGAPTLDLSGADLRGADFSKSYLWNINFDGADLEGADFSGATLQSNSFNEAVLVGSKWPGAWLVACTFHHALLNYAEFSHVCEFRMNDFSMAACYNARFPASARIGNDFYRTLFRRIAKEAHTPVPKRRTPERPDSPEKLAEQEIMAAMKSGLLGRVNG